MVEDTNIPDPELDDLLAQLDLDEVAFEKLRTNPLFMDALREMWAIFKPIAIAALEAGISAGVASLPGGQIAILASLFGKTIEKLTIKFIDMKVS